MESARFRSEDQDLVHLARLRAVSLSSWSGRDTKMTTRVTEGARREIHELFLWLTVSGRRKLTPGRSMGVFSGHDFNWLNLLFQRDGKCQDAYYQFCNTHFSFCLYSSCQRRQFENPSCFKQKMADFPLIIVLFRKTKAFFRTPEKPEINTRDFRTVRYHLFIVFTFEKGE